MKPRVAFLSIAFFTATTLLQGQTGSTTVIVSPFSPHGWLFAQETGTTGTVQFVNGPAIPPLGKGSLQMTTSAASDGVIAYLPNVYNGLRLDEITSLSYATYQSPGDAASVQAISLQFNIDHDVTDSDDSWKGRLVFEPYYTATVLDGTWQTWDPLSGKWWATGSPLNSLCPISSPCTLSQILAHYPNAGIHKIFGAVILKAGSGWPAFQGNVDALTIGVSGGEETTYDFELGPTNKEECKKGGWIGFFRNQGQCVSFFTRKGNQ